MGAKYTEAQKRAIENNRKKKEQYVLYFLPEKKDEYRQQAEREDKSLHQYIIDCIEEHQSTADLTDIPDEFEHSPRQMAEMLMKFNRDISVQEEEIQREVECLTELFAELQKSNKFNALAHHLDTMFTDSAFEK